MSLTLSHGPLAGHPAPTNYDVDGPAHRLLFDDFPRRVRGILNGETVLDSRRGKLLHETGLLPQLYVPDEDVRADLPEPTDHTTHCPFKGDATYWSIRVGNRLAENAMWAYPDPKPEAAWLQGYRAIYWDSMDSWLDEDEPVFAHLRDPYHRVDVRHTSRRVRVLAGPEIVAETDSAQLLSETGLPNRFYLPRDAVRADLEPSGTTTHCPYKGSTMYWTVRLADRTIEDAAWTYPDPFDDVLPIRDHVCFAHDDLTVEVDGQVTDQSMPRR